MLLVIGRVQCASQRLLALDRHFAQPHLREFARGLREVVDSAPEVAIHEVAGTQPFPGSASTV